MCWVHMEGWKRVEGAEVCALETNLEASAFQDKYQIPTIILFPAF